MNNLPFTHFVTASMAVSIVILFILIIKKGFKKHISIRWQYNMGLLCLGLLTVPFIPNGMLKNIIGGTGLSGGFGLMQEHSADMNTAFADAGQTVNNMNWLQDFTMPAGRVIPGYIETSFMFIWLIGVFVLTVTAFFCNRNLWFLRKSMLAAEENGPLAVLFTRCKADLGIKNKVVLGTSILAKSPMTMGFFRTWIILPANIEDTLSSDEISCILLHELTHYKNRDIPANNIMCLFQILYWFNPIVFLTLREIRQDREIACDSSVLKRLSLEKHMDYGYTLLKFACRQSPSSALSFSADMGGSKQQIRKRIENIASFSGDTVLTRVKSICIFTLAGLLAIIHVPAITSLAFYDDSQYQFQAANVEYEDLSSFFNDFSGSFVLYDVEADRYSIHNWEQSTARVSPNSTYKIYSALIALDAGVIDETHSLQEWNGDSYPYDVWNQDHNLHTAMQNSVSWYFQKIDAQVGIENLASCFKKLGYGNQDLSGGLEHYWVDSSLRISPVEQVQLLTDVYQDDTIFKTEHVNMLKEVLFLSEKDDALLYGKTGTGSVKGSLKNGWFIGYVENSQRTFVFSTYIQGDDSVGGGAAGSTAAKITLSILEDKGLY